MLIAGLSRKGILMRTQNDPKSNEETFLKSIIRDHFKNQVPYAAKSFNPDDNDTGQNAEDTGESDTKALNLDGNENPFGPLPLVKNAISSATDLHLYPDHLQKNMRYALSLYTGVSSNNIIVGNGCDELIDLLIKLVIDPGDIVLEASPTFGMYSFTTKSHAGQLVSIDRMESFDLDLPAIMDCPERTKLIFLASPNNPTGNLLLWEDLRTILKLPILVVVDETYFEFSGITFTEHLDKYPNLVILRSFSKWAGLAGLRIGYGMMHRSLVDQLMISKPPYSVNKAAEIAMLTSLQHKDQLLTNVGKLLTERKRMEQLISILPDWKVWPSHANFLLCENQKYTGEFLTEHLAKSGVYVRPFSHPRLGNSIRISVGLPEDTDFLLKMLSLID